MGLFKFLKEKLGSKKDEQKDKYVAGLDKSRKNFASRLKKLASTHTKIDDEYFEDDSSNSDYYLTSNKSFIVVKSYIGVSSSSSS